MTSPKLSQLEKEIATLILNKLEHLEITPERASEIAKFTLQTLPENLTDEQVAKILPNLDNKYYELAEIVHNHIQNFETAHRDTVSSEAEKLIHEGKIQQANQLMKQYFSQKPL